MTDAYREAEGDGRSRELEKLRLLDRFGVPALYGRVLTAREVIHMAVAEKVQQAYQARAASDNWAEWARKNKRAAALLARVEELMNG